jgi:hypothetical protein
LRYSLRTASLVAFCVCAGLTGCNASNSAPPTVNPTATPTPVPAPSVPAQSNYTATQTAPFAAPSAAPGATSAPIAISLPSALPAGYGGSISLASANATIPANTVVQTKVSNQQPAGLPILDLRRSVQGARLPRDSGTGTSGAAIEYVTLSFTNQTTFPTQPSFSFVLPSAFTTIPNIQFWIAEYDPLRIILGWQRGYEGPGAVTGTTIAFTPAAQTTIFSANQPMYFALYAISTAASTPTPAPVVSPQPTPAPLSAAPASLEFTALTDPPKTIAITDAATTYSGSYTATSADPTIASASISGRTLTVTPVARGFTTIAVSTTDNRQILVPVGVTTTTTTVQ